MTYPRFKKEIVTTLFPRYENNERQAIVKLNEGITSPVTAEKLRKICDWIGGNRALNLVVKARTELQGMPKKGNIPLDSESCYCFSNVRSPRQKKAMAYRSASLVAGVPTL